MHVQYMYMYVHMYMHIYTYLHNLWLVAWADGEHFEETTTCPQQLLICVQSHDSDEVDWTTTGQDDQLGGGLGGGG